MQAQVFDPKQVLQASMGSLGSFFGKPYGLFGEYAQFAPNKYFDPGDYYTADLYNAEAFYSSKTVMREAMDFHA
ncbi:MAG: hypothetical protein KGL39_43905 [Patescibacteria group bacterium]|nr:hypothetical protein [Patescibacteria group bacterium]